MGTIQNSIHTQEGMPKGIPFIIGNEAAERFSYYGMKAILTIFMVQYLKMTESDATAWYHNFSGAVYALPLLGALLSDLFFGKYKTILVLSLVYCSGHLVLALNESRDGLMWGLALIALGSGGIKPCVSAHVGDQFGEKNKHLVSKVFSYFYFAINFGSFFSTLLIPYLLDAYSPAVAFGLPGLLMLLATFVFWLGRKEFVHVPARPKLLLQEVFSKNFLFIVLRLGLVYLFISVFWALYDQTGSSWVIQSNSHLMNKTIDLGFWSFDLLPSQIQSANPVLVMMFVPLFTFILYPFLSKFFVVKPLYKIALGMFLCALSFFVISYAEGQIYQGKEVSVLWQLLAFVIITMGEVLLSLTALEYSYTQAPVSVKSIVMGLYLMSVSLGNFTTSAINSYIINPLKVEKIEAGKELYIYTSETHQSGDKVNIESDLGLVWELIF
jgi:proton-dependent oligopeptide transporter, POT family